MVTDHIMPDLAGCAMEFLREKMKTRFLGTKRGVQKYENLEVDS
jgi:hypothetical protein